MMKYANFVCVKVSLCGRPVDSERQSGACSIERHLRAQRIAQLWFSLDERAGQLLQVETIQQEVRTWNGECTIRLTLQSN